MTGNMHPQPYGPVWDVSSSFFWRRKNLLKILHWHMLPAANGYLDGFFLKLFRRYEIFRVSCAATRILGHRYSRSRTSIEVDLTYACNLRCNDCNRSVTQAPSNERISLAQIDSFLAESRAKSYDWEIIRLLGGEPTLHPEFHAIVARLVDYKNAYSPQLQIIVVTNGQGEAVQRSIDRLPEVVIVENTHKSGDPVEDAKAAWFAPFNRAPCDQDAHKASDFSNGCSIVELCGMGLTPYGYYPCAIAGGIDRVIGIDSGRKTLPDKSDEMRDQLSAFCNLCGHFCVEPEDGNPRVSDTWREKYAAWREMRPKFGRYGEASVEPSADAGPV
jgi:Radical SAM superfamily/4Fe-4S single cluster domain